MGDREYRPWILEQVLAAYIIGHYFVEMKQVQVSIISLKALILYSLRKKCNHFILT